MLSIEEYVLRWGAHLHIPQDKELRSVVAQALSIRTGDSIPHIKERLDFFHRLVTNEQERDNSTLEGSD